MMYNVSEGTICFKQVLKTNNFIEIQSIYYKIYSLKVYNPVVFSIFTMLYSCYHCVISERLQYPTAMNGHSPFSSTTSSWKL